MVFESFQLTQMHSWCGPSCSSLSAACNVVSPCCSLEICILSHCFLPFASVWLLFFVWLSYFHLRANCAFSFFSWLLVWYVNDGQLNFSSGIFSAVSGSLNLISTSIHGKDFDDVKWFKINFHGKLNQMLACIIPLPRFRAASDVWFCLAANFCIEITHYVNNIFFGALASEFFNSGIVTIYFRLYCISY